MESQEFLNEFIEEVNEHLQELESSLLVLEREGSNKEQIQQIFRAAHSIKGASAYMGFEKLASLTHELESLFSEIQTQSRPVPPEGISLLLECVDFISSALREIQQNNQEPPLPSLLLEELRNALSFSEKPAAKEEVEIPEPKAEDELEDLKPEEVPEDTFDVDFLSGVLTEEDIDEESLHSSSDFELEEDFFGPPLREESQESDEEAAAVLESLNEHREKMDEEDEELLTIFLDSFQDHLSQWIQLIPENPETVFSDTDFELAHELIKRMSASAHYMDYEPVAGILEEWEKAFVHEYQNAALNGQLVAELFRTHTEQLQEMLPRLQLPSVTPQAKVESTEALMDEEEDEELLTIFLDSIREGLSQLIQLASPDAWRLLSDSDFERAHELIRRMVASAQYMDYESFTEVLKEWETTLLESYQSNTLTNRQFTRLFNTHAQNLQKILPRLRISPLPQSSEEETLQAEELMREEDEELLIIFMDSLRENLVSFTRLRPVSPEALLSDSDFEQAHELIKRMVAAAQYMDYASIVEVLNEWETEFPEQYRAGALDGRGFVKLFNGYVQKLQRLIPRLQVPHEVPLPEYPFAAEEPIKEEDEELLFIFLDSLQENLSNLRDLCPASSEALLSEDDLGQLHHLIGRMITSCEYMDYSQFGDILEEWKRIIEEQYQTGVLNGQNFTNLFNNYTRRLQRMLPRLQVTPIPASSEQLSETTGLPIEEEDEELLNIFLESIKENLWKLKELTPRPPNTSLSEADFERAYDLINRTITSCGYMDYSHLTGIFEEWEGSLREGHQAGEVSAQAFAALFDVYLSQLQELLPDLQISPMTDLPQIEGLPEEEDEELLSIFLDSFQENLLALSQLTSLDPEESFSVDDLERAQDLIARMISSAQYMDYGRIADMLRKWEEDLLQGHQAGGLNGYRYTELTSGYAQRLKNAIPKLQLPDITPLQERGEEEIDDQIDHVFDTLEMREKTDDFSEEEPDLVRPVSHEEEEIEGEEEPKDEPLQPFVEFSEVEEISEPAQAEEQRASNRRKSTVVEDSVSSTTLRVDAKKVDQLLNQVGELVVTRSEFIQTSESFRNKLRDLYAQGKLSKQEIKDLRALSFRLNESTVSLGRVANNLQDSVMRIRMLPISHLFQRFPRVVRDQALKAGKKIELVTQGGETEMDKRVLEQMNDPLVQFLRNAIAHGLESPEERKRAKKPETGTILLSARHEGNHVVLEIEDDGRGIDTQKLRKILLTRKVMPSHETERLSDQEVMYSIFLPGISTRDHVDGTAGRGVGLDVVKENVERMNGLIEVESYENEGTRFIVRIPLTVAIIQALLVWEGGQVFTLPLTSVAEILPYNPHETHSIEGFRVINLRGKTIPVFYLDQLMNMSLSPSKNGHRFIVIVTTSFREVGLVVDGLMGEREVVIKSIEDELYPFEGFSGATILGDGSISLILDVSALLRRMKDLLAQTQIAHGHYSQPTARH